MLNEDAIIPLQNRASILVDTGHRLLAFCTGVLAFPVLAAEVLTVADIAELLDLSVCADPWAFALDAYPLDITMGADCRSRASLAGVLDAAMLADDRGYLGHLLCG